MHRASVTVLKAKLSEYLEKVKNGSEVSVTEHGKPVARLVPISNGKVGEDVRIARLVRAGILRRGRGRLRDEFLHPSVIGDPKGLVLKALLEEREENRRKGYR